MASEVCRTSVGFCFRGWVGRLLAVALAVLPSLVSPSNVPADDARGLTLSLRYQVETSKGSGRYHRLTRQETWKPEQTAIIVCDMWDSHSSINAVRRGAEFTPRLEQVLNTARDRGVTIIHAPSGCMAFYADHPARLRAEQTPKVANLPVDIEKWCYKIPAEEQGEYPLDQEAGGLDDDPEEHARWAKGLADQGLNPRSPWKRQTEKLTIDAERDYISDKGDEVWSILAQRGIQNVILTGVHTNMCVLGRPFGLRQMSQNGKNAVLLRDLTDTMYDPTKRPFVSHFTGTDLIISHIEKFVGPTISSDQLIGGKPFRFAQDKRPHVVIVTAEDEYETERTLPQFALEQLGKEFRVSYVFGHETERDNLPGVEAVADADVLVVSVRRRPLQTAQLELFRRHVAAGKPVIGLRTASHAFALRNMEPGEGVSDWKSFDADVLGGNYTGHHKNDLTSRVVVNKEQSAHPILAGLPQSFPQGGSLYQTSPVNSGATVLLTGWLDQGNAPVEPVAWTFTRADGGKTFYTSLGHPRDFAEPAFVRLLTNAVRWAVEK